MNITYFICLLIIIICSLALIRLAVKENKELVEGLKNLANYIRDKRKENLK